MTRVRKYLPSDCRPNLRNGWQRTLNCGMKRLMFSGSFCSQSSDVCKNSQWHVVQNQIRERHIIWPENKILLCIYHDSPEKSHARRDKSREIEPEPKISTFRSGKMNKPLKQVRKSEGEKTQLIRGLLRWSRLWIDHSQSLLHNCTNSTYSV
jgi:hypothetical protein